MRAKAELFWGWRFSASLKKREPETDPLGARPNKNLEQGILGHFGGFCELHKVQNGWGDVAKYAVVDFFDGFVHQNYGYGVGGVGGVWAAVWIDHGFAVAVVCNDDGGIIVLQGGGDHFLNAGVNGFAGLYGGLHHACVAHHIAVSKIEAYKIYFAFVQLWYQGICKFEGAHLWL